MNRILLSLFAAVCLSACSSRQIAPDAPQHAVQATSGIAAQGGVGDPRTRAKLHTELASLYFQDGNMAVALDELRIALDADAGYAPAYNVRGLVRLYLREMGLAEDDFRQALRIADSDPEINNNYGWFLCQIGREKESIAYFRRAVANSLYQTPERAYLNAGTCSQKAGDIVSAEDFFQKTLRFTPENPQALLQLAGINYKRGNYEAARKLLSNALRTVEPNAEMLWLALRLDRRMGEQAAEKDRAIQLRRKFPGSPEYQELLKGNFE